MTRVAPIGAAVFALVVLLVVPGAATQETVVVTARDARVRIQGNTQDNGNFSFWTRGVLGDWFVAPEDGRVVLEVLAAGRVFGGEGPIAAVDVLPLDGAAVEVGRIEVNKGGIQSYPLGFDVKTGFFTLRLRHTNRVAQEEPEELRHLVLTEMRISGARLAESGPAAYAFFGDGATRASAPDASARIIEAAGVKLRYDVALALWSVEQTETGVRLDGVRPLLGIGGVHVDLAAHDATNEVETVSDERFGDCTRVRTRYTRPGELDVDYTLLLMQDGSGVVAQLDFANGTGRDLIVNRAAPVVADRIVLGGANSAWRAVGDGKRYATPHEIVTVSEADEFQSYWHLAVRNRGAGAAVVFGSLTNNKGLGRFLLLPDGQDAMKVAAYSDYEAVVMPAGTRIEGEPFLLGFGRTGLDALDRFGTLVAAANGVHLMRDHPLDPYDPDSLREFNHFNSYGAGVVRGFDYKHDRSKGDQAFMDRDWSNANRAMVGKLGLRDYGYQPPGTKKRRGTPSPLARNYGNPDFWFKDAREMAEAHPEYYVDGNIDFSNPAVVEFEKARAARSFQDKDAVVTYGVDFTDQWRKLPGQHDPTKTSAETYRTAMGIYRDLARAHPAGGWGRIYMNAIGLNYDIMDILRVGQDSDQAYYGRVCSFTQGLTRQASGRWFYSGKVWWNNPDSFHVYAGGVYSYQQAKVHASFCAMSGNVLMIGEPFTDQDLPEERLDMIQRIAPMTADTPIAADMFENNPARVWNLPVGRPFGSWNVVGLFNVDMWEKGESITQQVDFADLGLDPAEDYLVYEFWSKEFLGVVRGGFERTLQAPDCEVYSIVEVQDHPVLISTNRHVRQMAYDVLDVRWDAATRTLSGRSKVVGGDPHQLRIHAPEGYAPASAKAGDLQVETNLYGRLLTVDFTSPEGADVNWNVSFE